MGGHAHPFVPSTMPGRILSHTLEGTVVKIGWGDKEAGWVNCVQSDMFECLVFRAPGKPRHQRQGYGKGPPQVGAVEVGGHVEKRQERRGGTSPEEQRGGGG